MKVRCKQSLGSKDHSIVDPDDGEELHLFQMVVEASYQEAAQMTDEFIMELIKRDLDTKFPNISFGFMGTHRG